jgi:hypothetical protein
MSWPPERRPGATPGGGIAWDIFNHLREQASDAHRRRPPIDDDPVIDLTGGATSVRDDFVDRRPAVIWDPDEPVVTMAELGQRLGRTSRELRRWEARGLIPPARRAPGRGPRSDTRFFTEAEAEVIVRSAEATGVLQANASESHWLAFRRLVWTQLAG